MHIHIHIHTCIYLVIYIYIYIYLYISLSSSLCISIHPYLQAPLLLALLSPICRDGWVGVGLPFISLPVPAHDLLPTTYHLYYLLLFLIPLWVAIGFCIAKYNTKCVSFFAVSTLYCKIQYELVVRSAAASRQIASPSRRRRVAVASPSPLLLLTEITTSTVLLMPYWRRSNAAVGCSDTRRVSSPHHLYVADNVHLRPPCAAADGC